MSGLPGRRLAPLFVFVLLSGSLLTSSGTATARDPSHEGPTWVPLRGLVHVGRTWGHRGGHAFPSIDFEVSPGQSVSVFAAGPGTVVDSSGGCPDTKASGAHQDCNGGHGNFVEIVHPNGRRSRYLHLREGSVTVEPGEYVCRGCKIGRTGWSGNVSPPGPAGAHLHYEELSGFRIVSPGRMWAKDRTGRVAYPLGGERWQDVGGEGVVIRNAGFPRPGPAPGEACHGWAATRVGTAGPDELKGTSGPDIIAGGDGNDVIQGLDGEDRICGGPGDDNLDGDSHRDLLDGGDGTDTCAQDQDGGSPGGDPEDTLVSCELPPYRLTVEVRCCVRFVTSQPAGISCPPDCSETYAVQTRVTLTLSSGGAAWQGCDEQTSGSTCVVTMSSNRHVSV